MPLYEVNIVTALTQAQKQAFAQCITKIHTRYFTTPSIFVNVRFNFNKIADEQLNYFVAGKPHASNSILATVRTGGGRTGDTFETAAKEIAQAWDEVVNDGKKDNLPIEKQLRAVFLVGDVLVALEAGFVVPKV
jgi:phenylpyruvate tautomerase PptA (4-oxalocrotonate tautomerase family)